jgi:hypothetical protein
MTSPPGFGHRACDQTTDVDGRTVKGINFFEPGDSALLHALQNPRINIAGIRRTFLPDSGCSRQAGYRRSRMMVNVGLDPAKRHLATEAALIGQLSGRKCMAGTLCCATNADKCWR